jgi:hypothetical protein
VDGGERRAASPVLTLVHVLAGWLATQHTPHTTQSQSEDIPPKIHSPIPYSAQAVPCSVSVRVYCTYTQRFDYFITHATVWFRK